MPRPHLFPVPPKKSPCRWASSLAGSPTSASRGWARGELGTRQLFGRAHRHSVAGCPSQLPSPLPRSPYPRPGASGTALEDTGTCSLSLCTCQSPWAETGGRAARVRGLPRSTGAPRLAVGCPGPPAAPGPWQHTAPVPPTTLHRGPQAGAEAISDAAVGPCWLGPSGP